jgi:2-dehydro-3-deoxygluconokinase
LWDASVARSEIERMLEYVDLLFVSAEEADALWGWADESAGMAELMEAGPREVVLKRGALGSTALIDGERIDVDPFPVREVDPIGAGDAFAAGYLASALLGGTPYDRLRTANAMGALCASTLGDYEGLPSAKELTDFMENKRTLGR